MSESAIRERAQRVRSLEAERLELAEQIRQAHKAGVSVSELVSWTGYSRRMIFYMLKENER